MKFIPNNRINIINKVVNKNIRPLKIIRSHKIISNSKSLKEGAIKVFGENFIINTSYGQNLINNRAECCRWLLNAFNWIWEKKRRI